MRTSRGTRAGVETGLAGLAVSMSISAVVTLRKVHQSLYSIARDKHSSQQGEDKVPP